MYRHGHYSKTKPKRDWVLIETIERYDGTTVNFRYFETEQQALDAKEKEEEFTSMLKPNQYWFGATYEVKNKHDIKD